MKHILIVEDDMDAQALMVQRICCLFGGQGVVQVSVACGGLAAAGILSTCKVDLMILDFDMPHGNGLELLVWMRDRSLGGFPIVTCSGDDVGNQALMAGGATHLQGRGEVMSGGSDDLFRSLLFP